MESDEIILWTTVAKGFPASADMDGAFLWCDEARGDARANALEGGHDLIKVTAKVVKAEKVDL